MRREYAHGLDTWHHVTFCAWVGSLFGLVFSVAMVGWNAAPLSVSAAAMALHLIVKVTRYRDLRKRWP